MSVRWAVLAGGGNWSICFEYKTYFAYCLLSLFFTIDKSCITNLVKQEKILKYMVVRCVYKRLHIQIYIIMCSTLIVCMDSVISTTVLHTYFISIIMTLEYCIFPCHCTTLNYSSTLRSNWITTFVVLKTHSHSSTRPICKT